MSGLGLECRRSVYVYGKKGQYSGEQKIRRGRTEQYGGKGERGRERKFAGGNGRCVADFYHTRRKQISKGRKRKSSQTGGR